MCFICHDLEYSVISLYDADILAVELAGMIGHEHKDWLRDQIKQAYKALESSNKSIDYDTDDFYWSSYSYNETD